jgi:hypothetical protein
LKFPHIKEAEIMARKKFVEDMQVIISGKSPFLCPVPDTSSLLHLYSTV